MIAIVEEAPGHQAMVVETNRLAFGGIDEALLVQRLHRDELVIASLVAVENASVVGHILFSTLAVEMDGRPVAAAALAPMAVRPDRQRRGIGTRLVEAGLARLRRGDTAAVIVLGHEAFYPRFGFSAELARRLDAPFRSDAFMALELQPGALAGVRGAVRYPAAFGLDG